MEVPDLKKKLEAAIAREDRWLDRHAEKHADPVQGASPEVDQHQPEATQTPNVENALPNAYQMPNIENDQPMDETTEFYKEVDMDQDGNFEVLLDKIESEAMTDIDNLTEPSDVVKIINNAMKKFIAAHKPQPLSSDSEILNIMKLANSMC